jgi:hypothetical protein
MYMYLYKPSRCKRTLVSIVVRAVANSKNKKNTITNSPTILAQMSFRTYGSRDSRHLGRRVTSCTQTIDIEDSSPKIEQLGTLTLLHNIHGYSHT